MIADRKIQPALKEIDKLDFQEPEKINLGNGIPTFLFNMGEQEIFEIDIFFKAGRWFETRKNLATAASRLLDEGTDSHTSEELSEKIDFYGANVRCRAGFDIATVKLSGLTRNLGQLMPLFKEILTGASFPEKEISLYKDNVRQNLAVNMEKVEYVAQQSFNEAIFGKDHPYGYRTEMENIDSITREDLIKFHKTNYDPGKAQIILAGKLDEKAINIIDQHLGNSDWKSESDGVENLVSGEPSSEKKIYHEIDKSVQSAIRIGKTNILKTDPDYSPFKVVNTILGGYFGSRLMSNIREDKGYTYGIYSMPGSYRHDGYFLISTEVGKTVLPKALEEIYLELERLINEPVPEDELQLVKNFMNGELLSAIDGPFNLAKTYKNLIPYGLDMSYLTQLFNSIKSITREEVQNLAKKHLQREELFEVVAG